MINIDEQFSENQISKRKRKRNKRKNKKVNELQNNESYL